SPDGRTLLTGSRDGSARLWSLTTRQPLGPTLWHDSGVASAAFSPDGRTCLIGTFDGTARFWRLPKERARGQPLAHDYPVLTATFSPDGKTVLTVSQNGGGLWAPATSRCTNQIWSGIRLRAMAYSPDGRTLAEGTWYSGLLLYELRGAR